MARKEGMDGNDADQINGWNKNKEFLDNVPDVLILLFNQL